MQLRRATPYPFSAVLFDLDGVVIDTTALHYRVWERFGLTRGFVPTPAQLLASNGRPARETLREWFGADLGEDALAAMMRQVEPLVLQALETEPVSAVPGVGEFLQALRAAGVPHALGTSATPAHAERALSRLGLSEAFPVRITAANVTQGKPHPEVYLKAAAALGVAPSTCLVFEDALSGLRAARAAGASCVALTTSFPRDVLLHEAPRWIAEDFRALPADLTP
ncbi:HAD family hydrolase [Melittangium boletus]|uniref:HAD family hydrolase n=1 Tax=Melittangium boletus TaxID=83453 RepID=UPI003DA59A69